MRPANEREIHELSGHAGWSVGRVTTPSSESHIVQFYDSEEFLCQAVTEFLAEGARAGEALVIIASLPHQQFIAAALRGVGVATDAFVFVDAHEMLSAFMVGDRPDEPLFRNSVGALIAAAAGPGKIPVRAYGEMADVLVCSGKIEASLQLEEFWNNLGAVQPFSLLCAHALENFYGDRDSSLLNEVYRRHGLANPSA